MRISRAPCTVYKYEVRFLRAYFYFNLVRAYGAYLDSGAL